MCDVDVYRHVNSSLIVTDSNRSFIAYVGLIFGISFEHICQRNQIVVEEWRVVEYPVVNQFALFMCQHLLDPMTELIRKSVLIIKTNLLAWNYVCPIDRIHFYILKKICILPNHWRRLGRLEKASDCIQRLENWFFSSTKPLKGVPPDTREEPLKVS